MQNNQSARLAMSVAALFIAACKGDVREATSSGGQPAGDESMPEPPAPNSGYVQCLGVHECKGKSACHVIGSHACAGQNTCKGKGWISVPAEECKTKGGKVLES